MKSTACVCPEYYLKMASGRRENGSLGIEVYCGKRNLSLPRELFGGKQKCI